MNHRYTTDCKLLFNHDDMVPVPPIYMKDGEDIEVGDFLCVEGVTYKLLEKTDTQPHPTATNVEIFSFRAEDLATQQEQTVKVIATVPYKMAIVIEKQYQMVDYDETCVKYIDDDGIYGEIDASSQPELRREICDAFDAACETGQTVLLNCIELMEHCKIFSFVVE